MPAKVKVTGQAETAAAFAALQRDVAAMPDAYQAVAAGRLGGVRSRTPVATGALAGSWETAGEPDRGVITSRLVYAGPIEYGWLEHNIMPARMVRDTLEAEAEKIADELGRAIEAKGKKRGFRVA
jgi:hypothetical protein